MHHPTIGPECPARQLFGFPHIEQPPRLVRAARTVYNPQDLSIARHAHGYECPECRLRLTCEIEHRSDADWLSCEIVNRRHRVTPPLVLRSRAVIDPIHAAEGEAEDCGCVAEALRPYGRPVHAIPLSIEQIEELADSLDYRRPPQRRRS